MLNDVGKRIFPAETLNKSWSSLAARGANSQVVGDVRWSLFADYLRSIPCRGEPAESLTPTYGVKEAPVSMRREVVTVRRYSLPVQSETWFRLSYEVRQGPRPGIEMWFLVGMEELSEAKSAA